PEYTLAQAAAFLECSERTIGRYISSGQIDAIRRDGRRLVLRESLRDFLRATVGLPQQLVARGKDDQDLAEALDTDVKGIEAARCGEDPPLLRRIQEYLRQEPVDPYLATFVGVNEENGQ